MALFSTRSSIGLIVLLGVSSQAMAKEITFYFDVNSSGPEIYPCNAGILHRSPGTFCHYKGVTAACLASQAGNALPPDIAQAFGLQTNPDELQAHACICTGDAGGQLMDYLKFEARKAIVPSASDWPSADHLGWGAIEQTNTVTGSQIHGDNRPHTVVSALWGMNLTRQEMVEKSLQTQLEKATFNLGSELYGAEYFIDMCYRGPQINYFEDKVNAAFSSDSWVQVSDGFNGGFGYLKVAKPSMEAYMVCDTQGDGTYQYADNGTGSGSGSSRVRGAYNTFMSDLSEAAPVADTHGSFPSDWVGLMKGDTGRTITGTSQGDISGIPNSTTLSKTMQKLWTGQWINLSTQSKTPRFCKARYYFKEKRNDANLQRDRSWQKADARVVLNWKVEETVQ